MTEEQKETLRNASASIPTWLLIVIMGGGNWFLTNEDGRLTREEAERVAHEVHALHEALDDFEARQKATLQKLDELRQWQQNWKNPER